MLHNDVPLRTRRALSQNRVYGESAFLVLNGALLNRVNVLLALSRRFEASYSLLRVIRVTPAHRHDGLVVRASASRSGGRGFEPRPGHTKDFKNGTYCLLVRHSAFKSGEGKLNTRSYQWTKPLL